MEKNKFKRLAIICGGTGGHFYPGLTIARAFQTDTNNKACLFVGGHKAATSQILSAKKYGVDIKEVESAKISKSPLKFILFVSKVMRGYLQGKKFLKEFKPDAVLAMGSFTSVPICLSAVRLRIPLFLHDGNAKVGRANLFLSRWAKLIMTAFPAINSDLLKCNNTYTGMPLRPEILNAGLTKDTAVKELNKEYNCPFKSDIPTILVFGGSQGAATINRVIPKTIPMLEVEKLQVIHLEGKGDGQTTKSLYEKTAANCIVLSGCDNMSLLYSVSDLVICRSGGSTIAELASFEKPAILIPYPFAAGLHQNDNADFYEKSGLADIVLNKDCNEAKMKQLIDKYLSEIQSGSLKPLIDLKKPSATEEIIQIIGKNLQVL